MNILALAPLGIAKKILLTENKSHGIFGYLLCFYHKKRRSFVKIRLSTEIDKGGITGFSNF